MHKLDGTARHDKAKKRSVHQGLVSILSEEINYMLIRKKFLFIYFLISIQSCYQSSSTKKSSGLKSLHCKAKKKKFKAIILKKKKNTSQDKKLYKEFHLDDLQTQRPWYKDNDSSNEKIFLRKLPFIREKLQLFMKISWNHTLHFDFDHRTEELTITQVIGQLDGNNQTYSMKALCIQNKS